MTRQKTRLLQFLGVLMLSLILSPLVQAQQNKELANQLIGIAEEIMKSTKAMDQARENYVQAAAFDPENIKANFFAGEFHLLTVHKARATDYFTKVKALDPDYRFDIDYKIGISLQYGLKFEEAIDHYKLYLEKLNDDPDYDGSDLVESETVENKIIECRNGIEYIANPVAVSIINLGSEINSDMDDFAPMFNEDQSVLVFTSRRRAGNQNEDVHFDNKPYEDIYFSNKTEDGWDTAQNLGGEINTNSHDSNLAMSPDGSELYVYMGENSGDIFITTKNNKELWSDPVRLQSEIDSEDFAETSLCLSPDGNMMIFASNRPFGEGDFDLYYTLKGENGEWGKPQNLGEVVNTESADDGPFLDYDGKTLYFSSEGHKGMGGYDIYRTVYDSASTAWSIPQNLGFPVNTADDDIYYITSKENDDAYYASVREEGFGHTDIYRITDPIPEEPKIEEPKELLSVSLKIKVVDAVSGEQIDAQVELSSMTDQSLVSINKTGVGTFDYEFNNENRLNYRLHVENPGHIFETTIVSIPRSNEKEQVVTRTISLRKLTVNTRKVLRNIYFHFDKATFKEGSESELNSLLKMMNDNSNVRIEISGHTDNIGAKTYNKDLSQRRADAIKKYLVDNRVQISRVESKGYGESKPLASNDDEREGREINRRVEFIVIK